VAKDIGSVTSSVAHLAHYPVNVTSPDKAYLFFGTGRYFYKTSEVDNANVQRSLFGIKEPCLAKMLTITTTSSPVCDGANTVCSLPTAGDLVDSGSHACIYDVTVDTAITTDPDGWYLNLDASAGTSFAERNMTDPLATTIGAVFFTTYAPDSDICTYGGNTYLWGLKYDTGGSVNGILQGTALMQVSTGAIEEVNLGTAFTDKKAGGRAEDGRRSGKITGAPPTGQGLSLVTPPAPLKKMMHIRKK
jgi:type IV pilus assembly protein PilY1